MHFKTRFWSIQRFAAAAALVGSALAQGTLSDYQRAQDVQRRARGLVVNQPGAPNWIGQSDRFWYSKTVKGGFEFVLVDAATGVKKPAFDHERLAAAINAASGGRYTALTLPFAPAAGGAAGAGRGAPQGPPRTSPLTFRDDEQTIEFGTGGTMYTCKLADYTCSKGGAIPQAVAGGRGRGGAPEVEGDGSYDQPMPMEIGGDPVDGMEFQPFPQQPEGGGRAGAGNFQPRCAPARPASNQGNAATGGRRGAAPAAGAAQPAVCGSFDGKWDALIENYNVYLRATGSNEPAKPLSFDGSEGNYYTLQSVAWSPDSKRLVAYHTRPGYNRQVHYIQSSPADQVQPKHFTTETLPSSAMGRMYRKPGDTVDIAYPELFDIATREKIEIGRELFPNAYSITPPVWWKDSRAFTFEYNERGHQTYRVIEVDANTGRARALIDERSKTFIYYNQLGSGLSAGRHYRRDIDDGKEIVWASERDGWEHLYLYDGVAGKLKNQITKGAWIVRSVVDVDETKRQITFQAGGLIKGQDPYFVQYARINFDGSGLTKLTDADGDHNVVFSLDKKYYVDTWSRVDMPPRSQLRRTEDQQVIADLETADASALWAAGFKPVEVSVAHGRDGETDIWGVITRPTNFDPNKKYPVIESIYAGPQGSFVPKTWPNNGVSPDQALAELGFIVAHIDGMGTSNRSKAFHDAAWKNLADAGFPDRILWHQALAKKYPWYDVSRVGIYGTSAGGQNALGALLFHPEFYKVAVTNSGCHDNRMDKMWWNEQWMGWPVGPQYAASSNVDNAYRLQGKALIIVGEMDTNVDPASSLQVVNALVKAHKHFDMLYIPGQDHGVAVLNSEHYRDDYFVHNLLGAEPPDWNKISLPPLPPETGGAN